MSPELERDIKRYRQWFGSYKKSVELVKVQVWLTINNGQIEFLDSLRIRTKLSACERTCALFATSAAKTAHRSPVPLKS